MHTRAPSFTYVSPACLPSGAQASVWLSGLHACAHTDVASHSCVRGHTIGTSPSLTCSSIHMTVFTSAPSNACSWPKVEAPSYPFSCVTCWLLRLVHANTRAPKQPGRDALRGPPPYLVSLPLPFSPPLARSKAGVRAFCGPHARWLPTSLRHRPMGSSAGEAGQQCSTRASVFFKNCTNLPRRQKKSKPRHLKSPHNRRRNKHGVLRKG